MSGIANDQTVSTSGANTTNSGAATQEDYVDKGKQAHALYSPSIQSNPSHSFPSLPLTLHMHMSARHAHPTDLDDPLMPAFDLGAKKSGHTVNRSTAEKITDGGRNLFEKATGKKVSDKISN